MLRYDVLSDRWSALEQKLSSGSTKPYRGDLKYSAMCRISSNQLILTGGCSTKDCKANSRVYLINIDEVLNKCEFVVQKDITNPRYGHCQVYNSGAVYIIGGFEHDDVVGLPPSTLTSSEIYVPSED